MANKTYTKQKQDLRLVPISRRLTRAGYVGEVVGNLGGSEHMTKVAQAAVMKGYAKELIVHGTDPRDGCVRQTFRVVLDKNDDDEMFIGADDNKTVAERIDPSLARALAHSKKGFSKRGLVADVHLGLRDEFDDTRRREICTELDLSDAAPPRYRKGEAPVEVLRVTPAKDRGMSTSIEVSRKRRQ